MKKEEVKDNTNNDIKTNIITKLNITATCLCLINCLLLPLFPLISPLFTFFFTNPLEISSLTQFHDKFHSKILLFLLPLSFISAIKNYKQTNSKFAFFCNLLATSILFLQTFLPHLLKTITGFCNCCYALYYTSFSAFLLFFAFYLNRKIIKQNQNCDCSSKLKSS